MIATRILKIDLEIAEIIEVKVGNHPLEIDILLLHRISLMLLHRITQNFYVKGGNFDLNYLSYF